jgi:hypothetical protein
MQTANWTNAAVRARSGAAVEELISAQKAPVPQGESLERDHVVVSAYLAFGFAANSSFLIAAIVVAVWSVRFTDLGRR